MAHGPAAVARHFNNDKSAPTRPFPDALVQFGHGGTTRQNRPLTSVSRPGER